MKNLTEQEVEILFGSILIISLIIMLSYLNNA